MAIATGTAIAIAAAASAGASLGGAKIASGASKEASKTEAASADKALEFSKGVYDTREQQLAPYRQAGASALAKGLALQGLSAPPTNAPPMATDPNHIQPGQPFAASMVPGSPLSGTPQTAPNAGGTIAQIGQTQQAPPDSGLIRIQAPDGSIRMVPSALQTQALASGGKLLSA